MNNCTDTDCQTELPIPSPSTGNLRWWGYKRTDGKIILRGFHDDYLPIHKAKLFKNTLMVYMPFSAQNHNQALVRLNLLSRKDKYK